MVEGEQIITIPPMSTERVAPSFEERALDRLLPHAAKLADRQQSMGLNGMLLATAIRRRNQLAGFPPAEQYVQDITSILAPRPRYTGLSRRDALMITATNISRLRQVWDSFTHEDTLTSLAIHQTITGLPRSTRRYGLSEQSAQKVADRFGILTAPTVTK